MLAADPSLLGLGSFTSHQGQMKPPSARLAALNLRGGHKTLKPLLGVAAVSLKADEPRLPKLNSTTPDADRKTAINAP